MLYITYMDKFNTSPARSEASCIAHAESYRGYELRVVHVTRVGSVLMDNEFLVFIGGEISRDELESLQESIIVGRQIIDSSIRATTGTAS